MQNPFLESPALPPAPTSGITEVPKGGQPREVKPDVLKDLALSFLTGVERAGIGLAGLPGDVGNFMRSLAGLDGPRMTGLTPTSEQIAGAVERATGPTYEPQTTAGEYARAVGEFAPAALFPGGVAGRAASVVLPGLASEAAGQATKGTSAEPWARVAGAVAGGVSPSLLRRAATPFPASPERTKAVQALQAEGVPVTAGQATGSKGLRYAESELGGGATARAVERQNEAFTRAVLKRAGIDANRATPEVIDQAFTRIGGQFDSLASRNQIVPQAYGQLTQALQRVATEYADIVPPAQQARIITKSLQDIAGMIAKGQPIPGNVYQSFRSRFDRLARSAKKDPQLSEALYGIRNALDDAMERSLQATGKAADLDAWRTARRQYRNMLVIERAAVGGGEDAAMGIISPAKLRQADAGQNLRSHARGKSDFSELAHAGQAVMSPMPQSGTAPRAWMRNVPAALMGAMAGGASFGTVGAGIGAALGPLVAGRALMSGPVQAYLRNQLVPGRSGNNLARAGVNALLARP
jgi:hypothetical protein